MNQFLWENIAIGGLIGSLIVLVPAFMIWMFSKWANSDRKD
ncbi:hypothetical protein [Gracilibacillus thailandensis]|nr:hypothetical protein [Gracilibacillus thailandensis]